MEAVLPENPTVSEVSEKEGTYEKWGRPEWFVLGYERNPLLCDVEESRVGSVSLSEVRMVHTRDVYNGLERPGGKE